MQVVWTNRALTALDFYCDSIKEESPSSAKKVKLEIINTSKELKTFPSKYQIDEYYPNNTGNIRRFFKWSYRVIYEITDTHVVILDLLHTRTASK